MRFAILGSGAVGGYFGAKLARSGQDVTFIARGAHLEAIRSRGLAIQSAKLGDFVVRAPAESDTAKIGRVDVAIVSVKAYDNATALPMLKPLIGPETVVLTLQNGVDSVDDCAATALEGPGLIVQTGVHRSIIFGEVVGLSDVALAKSGDRARITPRVQAIADVLAAADIEVTPVADARVPIWDKFVYLAAFAGFTGASRLAIGHIWKHPHVREMFYACCREIAAIAKAEGVTISPNRFGTLEEYMTNIPPTTRSSLLIDLEQGKRIEVEALQGAAIRRAAKHGVPVPIVATLYALLKPHEGGPAK